MAQGNVIIRAFTSDAEIPLRNAAVSIIRRSSDGSKELVAFRLTDIDGLTEYISIDAPDVRNSRYSESEGQSFEVVDILIEQVGYDRILAENVQVFPGVSSRQDMQLIPTAELPDTYDRTEVFRITEQNL